METNIRVYIGCAILGAAAVIIAAIIQGTLSSNNSSNETPADNSTSEDPDPHTTNGSSDHESDNDESEGEEYGEATTVDWSLEYYCGGDASVTSYMIDFDRVVGDQSTGAYDLIYESYFYDCNDHADFVTSRDGEGGLVADGEAQSPEECRAQAYSSALPSNLRPDNRSEKGVVEGGAFCLVTDQGRIVRAEISEITIDNHGDREVIWSIAGSAEIWEVQ